MLKYRVNVITNGVRNSLQFRCKDEAKRFETHSAGKTYPSLDAAIRDAGSVCPQFLKEYNYAHSVCNPDELNYYG